MICSTRGLSVAIDREDANNNVAQARKRWWRRMGSSDPEVLFRSYVLDWLKVQSK